MRLLYYLLILFIINCNNSFAQFTTNSGNVGLNVTPPILGNYGIIAINGSTSSNPYQGGYLSLMTNGSELGAIVANSQLNIQTAAGKVTRFYTGGGCKLCKLLPLDWLA